MTRLASLFAALAAAGAMLAGAPEATGSGEGWTIILEDDFRSGNLDPERWRPTSAHDFREWIVDVQDRGAGKAPDRGLRLRADTIGTDDGTVKFLGVVHPDPLDLTRPHQIEFELDWNNQSNGSYLSAGIYLSPTLTTGTPEGEDDWFKVVYVGVPPGGNVRSLVAVGRGGREHPLDTDGWPDRRRGGRAIDRQRIRLVLDGGSVSLFENDALLYRSETPILTFQSAYLYLQMTSHSNYPAREVFFDDLVVRVGLN